MPMQMPNHARLHLPHPALGACIYLGVERDTRGLQFTDAQRFNYYPASPLPMISWTFQGDLHMVQQPTSASSAPSLASALPRVVLAGPHRKPSASWSPGAVHALSVSFYPEALSALLGINVEVLVDKIVPLDALASGPLLARLLDVGMRDSDEPFSQIEAMLQPLWRNLHDARALPNLHGWVQSLVVRAAFSKSGAGIRRAQRRFRDWTGQSYRDLQLFVRTERAMAHASEQPPDAALDLAALAAQAGFADQSHMGREVRRVTGIPPGRLGELMRSDEAFWFYRLMMEHFREPAASRPG